jgi:hypothetical protein
MKQGWRGAGRPTVEADREMGNYPYRSNPHVHHKNGGFATAIPALYTRVATPRCRVLILETNSG